MHTLYSKGQVSYVYANNFYYYCSTSFQLLHCIRATVTLVDDVYQYLDMIEIHMLHVTHT